MNTRRFLYLCLTLAALFAVAATENFPEPAAQSQVAAVATTSTSTVAEQTIWYRVERVVDGDTLDILMNGKKERVRLIGLDTPEVVDPRKTVQCFGKEASEKAKQILNGASVRIETDPSQGLRDKYGRLLAYIFPETSYDAPMYGRTLERHTLSFNEYMIAEGYGHEYTYRLPYKYQREFKAAERSAREARKGLWAPDACAGNTEQPEK